MYSEILKRKKVQPLKHGYTTMELVVVVVVMGILAGLSIPNYDRLKDKNTEKSAYRILKVIRQAAYAYMSRENLTQMPNMGNIDQISTTLDLSLYEIEDITIACLGTDGGGTRSNQCTATHTDGWALRFNEESVNQIYCSAGTCPTCTADISTGCSNLE